MGTFLRRYALSVSVATALLGGCGGTQAPITSSIPSERSAAHKSYDVCLGHRDTTFLPSILVRTEHRNVFPRGLKPADLQSAYQLPSLSKGSGQIVADIEVCDNPNVGSDQAAYRSEFALPSGAFYKFNEYGQQSNYPPSRKGLGLPIDVDVEMIAAVCPNCKTYLIEANNLDAADLQTAEATAVTLGAHIINNEWGCFGFGCVDESYFSKKGITYIGLGAVPQPDEVYPADFDTVVAVGGTYLTQGGGKRGWTEKIWSRVGGGCFTDDPKPPWQTGTNCSGRVSNDVSMVWFNLIGFDSYDGYGSDQGWINVSGTGIPPALISGVFALAGNSKLQDGGRTFWNKRHQRHLYPIQCQASCLYGTRFSYADGWGSPHGTAAF